MLAVPLKKSKDLDWAPPLKDFIVKHYGGESVFTKHSSDITRLNTSRAMAAATVSVAGISVLKTYLQHLSSVEARFETIREGSPHWKQLQFVWFDSFQPKKSTTQTDLEFERANIVYNLAALESLAGMQQDRSSVEGIKLAIGSFQRAAGLFQSLELAKDDDDATRRIKGPLTADLSVEALAMLRLLMLAQAQVCVLEKATKDNLKPSVLAKLAMQASTFYDQALANAKLPVLAGVLDKQWALHLEFHKREHEAWAEFHASRAMKIQADETSVGYGEEIARLRRAGAAVRGASDFCSKNKLPAGLLQAMQNLMRKIQTEETRAVDENNKIYMSSVPDSVPALEGSALAKPVLPDDVALRKLVPGTPQESKDTILYGLLVPWVSEAETVLHSKLAALQETYGNKVQARSEEIRQRLAEAGLPAAVEAGSGQGSGVPDTTWQRITNQVVSKGGLPGLEADANENVTAATTLSDLVGDIERALSEEEARDAAARAAGQAGGSRPSSLLNGTMREDARKIRDLLAQAKRSDQAVMQRLAAARAALHVLSLTRDELAAQLPNSSKAIEDDPRVEPVRMELSLALVNLGVQVQECETAQARLIDKAANASVVAELIKSGESQADSVVSACMRGFEPLLRDIDAQLERTGGLFMNVLEKNHEFAALRTQNEVTREREAKLQSLDEAVSKYNELVGHVAEGARFYADLAVRVEQLRLVVNDFCFVRDVERADAARVGPAPQQQQQQQRNDEANAPIAMAYEEAPASPYQRMRDIIGTNASDAELSAFLQRANGDLNAAVNAYLEAGPSSQRAPPPPAAASAPRAASASQAVPAIAVPAPGVPVAQVVGRSTSSAPGKKKGWF